MQGFLAALSANEDVVKICKSYLPPQNHSFTYGLSGTAKRLMAAILASSLSGPLLIITHNKEELASWQEELKNISSLPVEELPLQAMTSLKVTAGGRERVAKKLELAGRLLAKERFIIIADIQAALQKGISPEEYLKLSLILKQGDILEYEHFLESLVKLGYQRSPQVELVGEYSIRGGIVDVYPLNSPQPVRIEFFDNEIDSIRYFNVENQLSTRTIQHIEIMSFASGIRQGKGSIIDFLPAEGGIILDEPLKAREEIIRLHREDKENNAFLFNWEEWQEKLSLKRTMYFSLLLHRLPDNNLSLLQGISLQGAVSYQGQMNLLLSDIEEWKQEGRKIIISLTSEEKRLYLKEFFAKNSLGAVLKEESELPTEGRISLIKGILENGFEFPKANIVLLTEKDIFGRQKKRLAIGKRDEKIKHFREIRVGDYVVHTQHGIGKYLGVETVEIEGLKRDYLHIQYGGQDKLFVPTEQVGLLQKYIGAEGEVPKLHRMGSSTWAKTKIKAKASAQDIARELVNLYAAREKTKGFAFSQDTVWQREFEEAFPYEETPDQLAAIRDIKADMEQEKPMDRLLCGDVGFGKTEVALRAAFKAVMDGKQVAILVPTTVLAQQHYQTLMERFQNFGPVVDVLNRFRSTKEQKEIIQRIKEGKIDILVGTHALLNTKRVEFKSLGLLIVDEEQRFGVKQKEKIKSLALGIDILTLSATPIPRTLHMSLSGARDMSIISTPPQERFPVQTYVAESSPSLLRSAIKRELKRGGQIYFVYNRIDTIDKMRQELEEIAPDALIQVAHGRMPEAALERAMLEFYEGKYDILLATSIIESGLDIANANTIIIYDADRMGLSQLYQMRGRVGRATRLAYAYLLYRPQKVLTEVAEKRLQAIKEFAELGAGFKIAMRDLEIRGAGEILGAQQHGHIAGVGFEMYCRLLEEAMREIKTGKSVEIIPDPVIEIQAEAYLDDSYIAGGMHKIELYQRIAAAGTQEQLDEILEEMIDRFGDPPRATLTLLAVASIRNYARLAGIEKILQTPMFLEIYFRDKGELNTEGILKISQELQSAVKFLQDRRMMRLQLRALAGKKIHEFVLNLVKILAGVV